MWTIVVTILLLLCVLFFWECKRELGFFKTTHYDISVPKLACLKEEKKIVLLADLHNKEYGHENQNLLEEIRLQKPDLILIAGDMLVGKKDVPFERTLSFIKKLPQICPVYYGLGNHEQRMKQQLEIYGTERFLKYKREICASGVHILENSSASCMLDELHVKIYGLELPLQTYEKFRRQRITEKSVEACIGEGQPQAFQMLLAHNPAFFPAYKKWGADLTLSGHLHGGMIRIPGLGAVVTPQAQLFPKYSGELTVEENQAIAVSKGLGTHTINLRFCNYAELLVLHLIPYKG